MAAPIGNKNAAKAKQWTAAIERALEKRSGMDKAKALEELATKLIEAALAGDAWALKEIGDRLEGKAAQQVQLSGDQENPLTFTEVVRKIVK